MSKQKSGGRRREAAGRRGAIAAPGHKRAGIQSHAAPASPRNHVASAFRPKNTATEAASQRLQHGGEHASERLQKILSTAGVASRRLSEELITQGRVSVNGTVVSELGTKADASRDEIKVDGRRIKFEQRRVYILLYKPRGYVTTRSDPQGRPTVMDLVRRVKEYVYPVGRLDYDSEGLLLLTNDGELAARLTHPRHEVDRVYEARVKGVPDDHELERLTKGMVIEGRRTSRARATVTHVRDTPGGPQAIVEIAIHEGRQRQVRKMFDAIGHPVVRLRRIAIGPIRDEEMPTGHYRELTGRELAALRRAAGIKMA
jgi:23S rRNA pseudouridine2605 synthase